MPDLSLPLRPGFGGLQSQASIETDVTGLSSDKPIISLVPQYHRNLSGLAHGCVFSPLAPSLIVYLLAYSYLFTYSFACHDIWKVPCIIQVQRIVCHPALALFRPLLKSWKPHCPPHPFEASRKALFSVEVKVLPTKVKTDIIASFLCVPFGRCYVQVPRTTILAHLAKITSKVNPASYLEMDDTLLPASSRSLSPGLVPSETGSSVQVHADIGSTRCVCCLRY